MGAVLTGAAHYQLDVSRERLRVALSWGDTRKMQDNVREAARQAGLRLRWVKPRLDGLTSWRLPVAIQLRDGQVAVVTAITAEGLRLAFSGDPGLGSQVAVADLKKAVAAVADMSP